MSASTGDETAAGPRVDAPRRRPRVPDDLRAALTPPRDGRGRSLLAVRLVALVATILVAGPVRLFSPFPTLDGSWMTAIAWARQTDVPFGSDVVFTYGPWGIFATTIDLDTWLSWLAVAFCCVSVAVMWTFVERQVRAVLWWPVALVVASATTVLALQLSTASWPFMLGVVGQGLALLARPRGSRPPVWQTVAMGLSVGLLLQVKFSEGLLAGIVTGLVVLRQRPRDWWPTVVATAGSFLAWWLLAGQNLLDIARWVWLSLWVAVGYQDAMYADDPTREKWVSLAWIAVAVVALLAAQQLWLGSRSLLSLVAVAGVTVFGLKQGFVRHDAGHEPAFFLVLVPVAAAWLPRRWLVAVPRLLLVVAACVACVKTLPDPPDALPPLPHHDWRGALSLVTDPDERPRRLAAARTQVQGAYALSPAMRARIGDRPVQVEPFQTALAWAYDLRWGPVPVFQPYSAYEPALDRANRDALLRDRRQVVVREQTNIDDRVQVWDSPLYNRALVCQFRPARQEARWTLLVRTPDRCGTPRALRTVHVRAGEEVALPALGPGKMLTAHFEPDHRPLVRALRSVVFKDPHPLSVVLGGATHRLPRPLAGGPLIVTMPDNITWSNYPEFHDGARPLSFSDPGRLTLEVTSVADRRPPVVPRG